MRSPFAALRPAVGPIALSAMTLLAGYLTYQNRQLLARHYELGERAALPVTGTALPTYLTRTLDGDSIVLAGESGGRQQLLFYFTTTCPYCEASLPAWQRIHAELAANPQLFTTVIGIAIDEEQAVRQYVNRHGISFPVVSLAEVRQRQLYRTRRVPSVVLIDSTGFVRYSRRGQLDAVAIDSVLDAARRASSVRSPTAALPR